MKEKYYIPSCKCGENRLWCLAVNIVDGEVLGVKCVGCNAGLVGDDRAELNDLAFKTSKAIMDSADRVCHN